jgi:hypothetical protein
MIESNILERTLSVFSDPATLVSFESKANRVLARLIRYGEQREYFIDLTTEQIQGRHNKRQYSSLKSLLASEDFSDLRSFANTQRRVLFPKKLEQLLDPAGVIDPSGLSERLTLGKGRELFLPKESAVLKILLIDGPAGVGKTSFIERMVFERANEVTLPPILHITSKGRRLSNLPDAIGKTASDLQADFRADQVPVLARMNALQVAIDGFDELVQPDGYENAWAALEDFIRLMGQGGPLILAGRDTFFDQHDVRKRLDRFGTKVDLTMVRLHEVSEQAAKGWLQRKGWQPSELASPQLRDFFRKPYTRRPFFLSQISAYKSFSDLPAERGSPQAILIDELIGREANLISAGINDVPTARIKDALSLLFEEMATDMADREAETIPREFLEFYCDVAFDGVVGGEELSAIRHKVGSVAFIEANESRGDLRFPHSEIQNHFLAQAIFRALAEKRQFAPLRSATFGTDLVEAFADVNRTAPFDKSKTAAMELLRMLNEEPFAIRLVSNLTALIIAHLVRGNILDQPPLLKNVSTTDARVFDELGNATLTEVTIGRLDARGADLSAVDFDRCQIGTLIVDETTRFGTSIPDVGTLQIEHAQSLSPEHSKENITAWLREHSSAFIVLDKNDWRRGQELPLVKFFDRVCRRFIRQHYIRDAETDEGSTLLRDRYWPEVLSLLQSANRITIEQNVRDASFAGRRAVFYHISQPEKLLAPEGDKKSLRVRLAVINRAEELQK